MPTGHIVTHEDYITKLFKTNKYYRNGEFIVIGIYINTRTKILIRDKYGELLVRPDSILYNHKPNIKSAVNKTEYFKNILLDINDEYKRGIFTVEDDYKSFKSNILIKSKYGYLKPTTSLLLRNCAISILSTVDKTEYFKNMLLEFNEVYRNGEFWIISEYIENRIKILCEDKYGKSIIFANHLLQGYKPSIRSAVNPTEYCVNQFIEKWGDKYGYEKVDYKECNKNVQIWCKVHKEYFSQTPTNHLRRCGCVACKDDYNQENPTGWTLTNWIKAKEHSKNFDSYKLYIIRLFNENEEFFKIGRTFRTLKNRFKKAGVKYKHETLKEVVGDAKYIFDLETELKRLHKPYKYLPKISFDGMHECFSEILWDKIPKKIW